MDSQDNGASEHWDCQNRVNEWVSERLRQRVNALFSLIADQTWNIMAKELFGWNIPQAQKTNRSVAMRAIKCPKVVSCWTLKRPPPSLPFINYMRQHVKILLKLINISVTWHLNICVNLCLLERLGLSSQILTFTIISWWWTLINLVIMGLRINQTTQ